MSRWAAAEGSPSPLGVSWIEEEQSYNFALYARHATDVTLLLYTEQDLVNPVHQLALDYLKHKTARVWHCRVPVAEMNGARYYAYQVDGPNDLAGGGRFDPQKILLDPYAGAVFFPPTFSRAAAKGAGSNAGAAPLGIIAPADTAFDWSGVQPPRHSSDTIIYEVHVKGFTARDNSGVTPEARGTFAGMIEKIPYLQELGVTVVELLPIFQYDPQEGNYWGYMPLHFFSPQQSYASAREVGAVFDEFRAMVKAFHAAGIEVILDVVYNHTVEAGDDGPTYSYRGIDNSSYYLLGPDGSYRNDAGTGNVLRCGYASVRKFVIDSMRFWINEMRVDGFRFDLASILTRSSNGDVNLDDPAVISEISADPDFADIRLIAEAWDITSYQLGRSFPGLTWSQWNGKYRDDIRAFVKGDNGKVPDLMRRLYGSDDLFPDALDDTYHPFQSINFITAHDGFCLYDLVAYNRKHNEANGHNNQDGTDDNLSWNCGWEGDNNVPPQVMALRKQQIKNFCCLLMISNGTPMFCAGDEFMNTQGGNNNPYNQDNQITWLDWDLLQQNQEMFRFFKTMIAFRKAHPSLSRSRYWREEVRWYGVGREVDTSPSSHTLALCVAGASQHDRDIYIMINAYWQDLDFTIQEGQPADWLRVVDTALPSPADIADAGSETPLQAAVYTVRARSVVVLLRR
jgi:isoamylase